jgi:hypothetical protein
MPINFLFINFAGNFELAILAKYFELLQNIQIINSTFPFFQFDLLDINKSIKKLCMILLN